MTEPDGMYGEEMRRALSAVADLVVPTGDGLAKIRQRTRQRPPAFAWLFAYATYLPRLAAVSFRVPASELVLMAKGQSTLHKRMWAGLRLHIKRLGKGSPNSWMRPALAAAGALAVVVAVMLVVPGLRTTVDPTSQNSNIPGGGGGAGTSTSAGNPQSTSASTSDGPVVKATTTGPESLITRPAVGSPGSQCTSSGSSGGGSYIPPVGNPTPTATAGIGGMGDVISAKLTAYSSRCSAGGSPSPSTSPTSSSPTSSPTTSPTTTPPTSPSISPSGGGTPTPTGTAISDSPTPSPTTSDSGSGSPGS
jgi:hypothetical protein